MSEPMYAVYRIFNADDELLYVGVTKNIAARMKQHQRSQAWWPSVASITTTWFETVEAASAAEIAAIQTEQPSSNINGVGARAATPYRGGHSRVETAPATRKRLLAVAQLRKRAEVDSRAVVAAALAEGVPIRDIAELTGLSTRTVQDWKANP